MTRISSRNTGHSTIYAKSKNYNFDPMQLCLFSVANTFIVFAFKTPLILTIYGHVAGNLNFFNYL